MLYATPAKGGPGWGPLRVVTAGWRRLAVETYDLGGLEPGQGILERAAPPVMHITKCGRRSVSGGHAVGHTGAAAGQPRPRAGQVGAFADGHVGQDAHLSHIHAAHPWAAMTAAHESRVTPTGSKAMCGWRSVIGGHDVGCTRSVVGLKRQALCSHSMHHRLRHSCTHTARTEKSGLPPQCVPRGMLPDTACPGSQ